MEKFVEELKKWKIAQWVLRIFGPTLSLSLVQWIGIPAWFHGPIGNRLRYVVVISRNFHFRQAVYAFYDREMVPIKARYPGPVTWVLRVLLRAFRIKFLWNIAPGTGHNTVELDYFFRLGMKSHGQNRVIFLRRSNPFHNDSIELFRDRFWFASKSDLLCDFFSPVVSGTESLRIDCGLSRLKWQVPKDRIFDMPPPDQSYFFQIDKTENIKQWRKYYALRSKTDGEYPLGENIGFDSDLVDFLGIQPTTKLALIHIKYHVANATAAPSKPSAYEPTIRWLMDRQFQVIQVGREPCSPSFKDLGVIPYCESSLATYKHDLQLFSVAKLAITAGSGIAFIPDCLGIPYVYLDSWHLGMPMASSRCVMVPALVVERGTGKVLSFADQVKLYRELQDRGDEIFPSQDYDGCNAAPEEILDAVREVLDLGRRTVDLTSLQCKYRDLLSNNLLDLTKSRVSQGFLEKHADLLLSTHPEVATKKYYD